MPNLPLSKFRVVELGTGDTLGYCGKLFADFGAEVIKIEPTGGDPGRRVEPRVDAGSGERESVHFAWLNTNKSSIIADPETPEGARRITALLETADVLLDARHPPVAESSELSHAKLRAAMPGLAITAISWFGEHGPYRDYAVTESVCRSLAGLVKLVGHVEGPPVLPRDGQTGPIAGITAFIPTLAGLYGNAHGARRFAINNFDAMLQISEFDIGLALESGFSRPRPGINRFGRGYPSGNFPTKHGWLGITVVTPAQWAAFCQLIELPELAKEPKYSATIGRFLHADELGAIIRPVLLHKTAMDWFQRGIELRLPLAVVPDMKELLEQEVHRSRGAFGTVNIGDASFEGPVVPQHLTRSRPLPNGRAPRAGEHDRQDFPAHTRTATRAATANDPLPLKGLRIIDLTMGWAGPTATRQMADLGADVIKIESCQYPDWFRGTDTRPPYHEERTYEKTHWFQYNNRNKRGITLDLTSEKGLSLLKQLIAGADGVIDNYAADVMPRLGLGTDAIFKLNPRAVVLTMPAFGMTGAWSGVRAYGSTLEQASGLPSVTGREEDPPTMLHTALGDPVGGLNAAAALMVGFMHQKNTGQGQHIDLSQVQCMLPLVAPSILEQSATGTTGPRLGNRHPEYTPHGCFPCLGNDQWLTLAVRSDEEWQALCKAMRRPDLAADPALATADGRRNEEDRIEVAIRTWLADVRPDIAMMTLQGLGVPAGIARLPQDLAADPHLMTTGHWQVCNRAFIGPHLEPSAAYREGDALLPYKIEHLAPTLGQHNDDVLRDVLGLTADEIAQLAQDQIIGTEAIEKKPVKKTDAKRKAG
ncbi:carnitine dehydratase [Afipia sp. Root123D2]|uniref:CaiB/BaiF CoA transferase family protein n=1 Tax=Afipia sp. Root123D2 TaxID=1736436 RepID=UPI0006FA2315|nr:CoA transferase [Afipia sp. Root123D2]KQW22210.1 carnitine dehydratase [Afipia sp. Root123D2]